MRVAHAIAATAVIVAACRAPALAPVPTLQLADIDESFTDKDQRRAASSKACPAIVRPRLWRIEKAGKTSHVFGTYHVGVSRDRLPAVVDEAFARARVIAFESLSDDETTTTEDEQERPALSVELGAEAWARLVALVGPAKAADLEDESAIVATLLLSVMYIDFEARLDEELEEEAKRLEKRVVALESSESLDPLIGRWLGVRTLRASLMASRGRRDMRDKALASLADYCTGRDRDVRSTPKTQQHFELLEGRNKAWMAPLEALLAEGGAFIAVGAAHLRGEGSVLDLLVSRGYRVTRVE